MGEFGIREIGDKSEAPVCPFWTTVWWNKEDELDAGDEGKRDEKLHVYYNNILLPFLWGIREIGIVLFWNRFSGDFFWKWV